MITCPHCGNSLQITYALTTRQEQVLALMDGTRSRDEIAEQLGLKRTEVNHIIRKFLKNGRGRMRKQSYMERVPQAQLEWSPQLEETLRRRHLAGASYASLGQQLGVSGQTVQTHIDHAWRRLRREDGDGDAEEWEGQS